MLAIRGVGGVAASARWLAWKGPPRTAASEARLSAPARTHAPATDVAGRSTSSTSAPRRRSTASSPRGATGRSATSCSRSPTPRAATRRTGWTCSAASRLGCRGPDAGTVLLGWMAKRFGSIFVLALAQNAEARSPYDDEPFATPAMAADEKIHHEVVRGLAARGRRRLSGTFRAAVFGANDGLVSNLALVMGIGATGVVAAVRALQRHRRPARRRPVDGGGGVRLGPLAARAARGDRAQQLRRPVRCPTSTSTRTSWRWSIARAGWPATEALDARPTGRRRGAGGRSVAAATSAPLEAADDHEVVGGAWSAALSSFLFFASGAIIPVLPWIFGLSGLAAVVTALVLVGIALLATGAMVGLLSGGPPLRRALRQLRSASARRRSRTCSGCSSACRWADLGSSGQARERDNVDPRLRNRKHTMRGWRNR